MVDMSSLPATLINVAARKLVERGCWLVGDGFRGTPPTSDVPFWEEVTKLGQAALRVAQPQAQRLTLTSSKLGRACHEELEVLDVSEIRPGVLYLSDISSAGSRLGQAVLGIRGIVLVSSEAVAFDKTCHVIDGNAPLADQLPAAVSFSRRLGGAVLVCSQTGRGVGAMVCAAILAASDGVSAPVALAHVGQRRGLPLRVETDEEEELSAFCDAFLRMEFQLRLGRSSPRISPVSTPKLVGTKRPRHEVHSPLKKAAACPPAKKAAKANAPSAAARSDPVAEFDGWSLDHGVDMAWHGGRALEE